MRIQESGFRRKPPSGDDSISLLTPDSCLLASDLYVPVLGILVRHVCLRLPIAAVGHRELSIGMRLKLDPTGGKVLIDIHDERLRRIFSLGGVLGVVQLPDVLDS